MKKSKHKIFYQKESMMIRSLCVLSLLPLSLFIAGCDDKKAPAQTNLIPIQAASTAISSAALGSMPYKPGNKDHELVLDVYAVLNFYTFTKSRDKINRVEIVQTPNDTAPTGLIIKVHHGNPEVVHFMKLSNADVWTIVAKRNYIPPPGTVSASSPKDPVTPEPAKNEPTVPTSTDK